MTAARPMFKYFVESKLITAGDFDASWPAPSLTIAPGQDGGAVHPRLAERQIMPVDKSLKLLADRSRLAFIPLDRYELDIDLVALSLARVLPALVRGAL